MNNVFCLPLPDLEVSTIHVWPADSSGYLIHAMCRQWDSGSCPRTFGDGEHLETVSYAIDQVRHYRANGASGMTLGDVADGSY